MELEREILNAASTTWPGRLCVPLCLYQKRDMFISQSKHQEEKT